MSGPTGLTPKQEENMRAATTGTDPYAVHSASVAAWANVWFMLDEARAALADERKHAAFAWRALEDMRCTCEAVFIGGMPSSLKCARCRALEVHDSRKEQANG